PMFFLAAVCGLIRVAPLMFWPALSRAIAVWQPAWASEGSPPPLLTIGTWNAALAVLGTLAAVALWTRLRCNGVTRQVTWDCGYAAPSPRMQYTAGSFASIITEWFAWILRPEKDVHAPDGLFPSQASRAEHTPEAVLEKVVEPVGSVLMVASRA